MDVEIDRLSVQLHADISPERAQAVGDLIGEALRAVLNPQAAKFSAAPAGYRVPSLTIPTLRVRAGASDDEIAQTVATALVRAVLRELEL
jgi:hypothetical protein